MMEMKVDKEKLKQFRESNAWSQSHLAEVSGISLRTIQRIEKTGVASAESVKSICATFEIQVNDITINSAPLNEREPTFASALSFKLTNMDKRATLVSFIIAFIIAFLVTM